MFTRKFLSAKNCVYWLAYSLNPKWLVLQIHGWVTNKMKRQTVRANSFYYFLKALHQTFSLIISKIQAYKSVSTWFYFHFFGKDGKFLIFILMFLCLHIENGSLETCTYVKFNPLQLVTSNCNQRRGSLCTYSMSIHTTLSFFSFIIF